MEQLKYDVFISYSRKDYVDEQKNQIPGNVISIIKDTLNKYDISYWMDEEGNLTGKKFAHIIAGKIRESMVFLFVCSKNSVASRWVDRELSVADTLDKHIIPFICDESYLDDKVIMFTSSLDRIEFKTGSQKELEKLINTIEKDKIELQKKIQEEKELLLKKQQEEEERRKRLELEEKRKKVQNEIEEQITAFKVCSVQQESILQQLYDKNLFLGKKTKLCPVCQSPSPLEKHYCGTCSWQFPLLYSLDGNDSPKCDDGQLSLARTNWNGLHRISELQDENQNLRVIRKELEDAFKNTSMQLEFCKQEVSLNEEQKKSNEDLISKLQKEIESLKQDIGKYEQEITEKEKLSQEQISAYKLLEEKYNQAINDTISSTLSDGVKRKVETINKTASSHNSVVVQKKRKYLTSYDEAFSVIESCCDRSPIQDNYDLNQAKLSLSRLKNILDKKYNLYISKSAIIACKNIGELKILLYNSSNKKQNKAK